MKCAKCKNEYSASFGKWGVCTMGHGMFCIMCSTTDFKCPICGITLNSVNTYAVGLVEAELRQRKRKVLIVALLFVIVVLVIWVIMQ